MSFNDAYVTVTLLATLFTPVVLWLGWIEHRDEWRHAHNTFTAETRHRLRLSDRTHRRHPAGTVQNPTDPSPKPRNR